MPIEKCEGELQERTRPQLPIKTRKRERTSYKILKLFLITIVLTTPINGSSDDVVEEISCFSPVPEDAEDIAHRSFNRHITELILNPYLSIEPCSQRLFILHGTSSCGKTSLCKSLKQRDPQLIVLEHDEALLRKAYKVLGSKLKASKQEKPLLRAVMNAVWFEDNHPLRQRETQKFHPSYQMDQYVKTLQVLLNDSLDELYDNTALYLKERARFYLALGRRVVIDLAILEREDHSRSLMDCFEDLTPSYYLIYGSLRHLVNNISKRNTQAISCHNKSLEWRPAHAIVQEYISLFSASGQTLSKRLPPFQDADFIIDLYDVLAWPLSFLTLNQEETEKLHKCLSAQIKELRLRRNRLSVGDRYSQVLKMTHLTPKQAAQIVHRWIVSEKCSL